MPQVTVPRSGSLQFVPKKRTKRIYPTIKFWKDTDKTRIGGFAGYKAGMIHALIVDNKKNSPTKGETIAVPITVLDCPPLHVIAIRFYKENTNGLYVFSEIWDPKISKDKDLRRKIFIQKKEQKEQKEKFEEIQKNIDSIKKIRLLVKTSPRLSGIGKKKPEIFEIEVGGKDINEKFNYCKEILGKEIKAKDVFKDGEYVDAVGVTTGKGFEGVVKRFGVKLQNRKNAKKKRHIGTLGPETPRRVIWTIPYAGQLGFFKRTEFNKRILKIGENGKEITPKAGFKKYGIVKGDYILIEGSVPGPTKRLIMMKIGTRSPKTPLPTEIKTVIS